MKKRLRASAIVCLLAGLLVGCSTTPAPSPKSVAGEHVTNTQPRKTATEGKYVTILTGGTSGVYFQLGNALAKVYGEHLGAKASAQTTEASAENTMKIQRKQAELAFAMADIVGEAYRGEETFVKTGPLTNLSAIASLYPNYMQLVTTKKSGIKTLQDLKGKRVAVGAIGSGTEIMSKRVLEACGLSYNDVNVYFLSFAEGVAGVGNQTIDAAFLSSGYPNTGIMELAATNDIRLIPLPKELVAKMKAKHPAFTVSTIPANTYKGVTQEIETAMINNILITHKDLPEDEVYELTKALFDHMDALGDAHSSAKSISLKTAAQGLPIPLHPGAERFYRERGVLQ